MYYIRVGLALLLVCILTITAHVYVATFPSPFNVLHIFSITLILLWLLAPRNILLWITLIFGTLLDFIEGTPIGTYGIVFIISLGSIIFLHRVLITQEKPLSIFLLILFFMAITRISEHGIHARIAIPVLEESVVAIAINTCGAFILYIIIMFVRKELSKRFI